ncbi:uncharacterized protein KQ657_000740 [Scheffersomyces spartinae]|uniref:ABM domain-containing protein n=1 Tax=Scheffersomyces spartinae TaxID=45513 RepID=A0A9P7V8U4_9ASCO|nr:uncharacterized protein KQ657_000740 [Scheffersomyces spartinae]KAG7193324.1 hypothetical protein KQ657_000740 [Scheffersomyces spartinae]
MSPTKEPYYSVIFISTFKNNIDSKLYSEIGMEMIQLAKKQPGYLGIDSARDPDTTTGITVSYWKDEQSIASWKKNQEHLVAQRLGRTSFYKHFKTIISKVEREYEFNEK